MYIVGVLFGLACALGHSISYLFSRHYVVRGHGSRFQLLAHSQLIMGAFAAVLLPVFLPGEMPSLSSYFWPLMGATAFYLVGQLLLLGLLRNEEASRVSPLLALKIAVLAVLSPLVLGQSISALQWMGVLTAVGAAFVLSFSGAVLRPRLAAGLLAMCLAYALSDVNIALLLDALPGSNLFRKAMLATCLCYVVAAVPALAALPRLGRPSGRDIRQALPFAITWFLTVICLFLCFALVGVVLGTILQSTRGVLSLVLAVWMGRLGLTHLEQLHGWSVFVRRLLAALMMTAAIALYTLGRPGT